MVKECKAAPRCEAPEVEGRKGKFLQLNLGRGKEAHDLLMQTARERGADVLLTNEQHKWFENSAWYQDASRRAGILICSPDSSIGDFLETDAEFVWVEVAGVCVYSCYFSPNDPFKIFETQILLLEESLREVSWRPFIAGDFNSKSPEWGEARLDRRGILVSEMVARNDLIALNRVGDFTFRRGAEGSIIDLTIAAPRLASRIGDWCVLEVITLSDHQCIEFSIQKRSHPVNAGRGGKVRSPSWNTKRLSKDKLREHLGETRLIDQLGRARSAESLEDTVQAARRKLVAACDLSMRRRGHGRTGDSMYWWDDQLFVLRRNCLTLRRRFTRSKGDHLLREAWKIAKSALRQGIKKSRL